MLKSSNASILAKFNSSSGIKINNATTSVIIEIDKLNELDKTILFIAIDTLVVIVLFCAIIPSACKFVNSLFIL